MKIKTLILPILLSLMLALTACAPGAATESPYPVDGENPQTQPTGDDEIETPYPIEPTEPTGGEDAVGGAAYITDPQADPGDLADLAQANNDFALDLYLSLTGNENLVFSPYSVYQALLMTYAGADGETARQMIETLALEPALAEKGDELHNLMNALNKALTTLPQSDQDIQPLVFTVANALWAQADYQLEQDFLDTLSANYSAGVKLVDFNRPEEARQLINLWVAAQTNDKIEDLIPEGVLNEMTRLVLTNAVYFKGAWSNQFDPGRTSSQPFNLLDGSTVDVDMMALRLRTGALVNESFSAVSLPYEGGSYAMAAIMPANLANFEAGLTGAALTSILADLAATDAQVMVNLGMPKFQFDSTIDLSGALRSLGMTDLFDRDLADLSRMNSAETLYVSDILHKAFIEVNEEGTEAAASTAVVISVTSMPGEAYDITFDNPFIYVIYEKDTNTIVFMGRVVEP